MLMDFLDKDRCLGKVVPVMASDYVGAEFDQLVQMTDGWEMPLPGKQTIVSLPFLISKGST